MLKRKAHDTGIAPATGGIGATQEPEKEPIREVEGRPDSFVDVESKALLVPSTTGIITETTIQQLKDCAEEFAIAKENLRRAQSAFDEAKLNVDAMVEKVRNKIFL